jgi:hypothetical protein
MPIISAISLRRYKRLAGRGGKAASDLRIRGIGRLLRGCSIEEVPHFIIGFRHGIGVGAFLASLAR